MFIPDSICFMVINLPETQPLKMVGFSNWNLNLQGSIFRCELLVSGRI